MKSKLANPCSRNHIPRPGPPKIYSKLLKALAVVLIYLSVFILYSNSGKLQKSKIESFKINQTQIGLAYFSHNGRNMAINTKDKFTFSETSKGLYGFENVDDNLQNIRIRRPVFFTTLVRKI